MDALLTPETRRRAAEARQEAKDPEALLDTARLDVTASTRKMILRRLRQMPQTMRRAYLSAMKGRRPVAGIRAFCFMCVGWQRGEVGRCSDPACPLHPYRPERT